MLLITWTCLGIRKAIVHGIVLELNKFGVICEYYSLITQLGFSIETRSSLLGEAFPYKMTDHVHASQVSSTHITFFCLVLKRHIKFTKQIWIIFESFVVLSFCGLYERKDAKRCSIILRCHLKSSYQNSEWNNDNVKGENTHHCNQRMLKRHQWRID